VRPEVTLPVGQHTIILTVNGDEAMKCTLSCNDRQRQPCQRSEDPHLTNSLRYMGFLKLMSNVKVVLTDSGEIQEETTILQITCLRQRENTERPLTAKLGTNQIVRVDPATIIQALSR
jgi:UDP-N-acetylglucosamine 2-epimerase